jgi:hypothetical protein
MVLLTDTAPEEVDDRKPPAPESDTDSKYTAPDEGDTDRKDPDPDDSDADFYMIHLPNRLKNEIRATVVNMRHLNDCFCIEDNHFAQVEWRVRYKYNQTPTSVQCATQSLLA